MSEINIPTEILNKIINLGGLRKPQYCKRCKEFTEHISISYGELPGHKSGTSRVFSRLLDYVPIVGPIVLGNPFACTKCGQVRADGGLGSDDINKNADGQIDIGTKE